MANLSYWFEFNLNAFLWIFIILNVVNVVIQTVKTIVTVNGTPLSAAIINAVTFAIYTVVVVFMNADGLGVFWKAVIIGVVNFIGVYVVKLKQLCGSATPKVCTKTWISQTFPIITLIM